MLMIEEAATCAQPDKLRLTSKLNLKDQSNAYCMMLVTRRPYRNYSILLTPVINKSTTWRTVEKNLNY